MSEGRIADGGHERGAGAVGVPGQCVTLLVLLVIGYFLFEAMDVYGRWTPRGSFSVFWMPVAGILAWRWCWLFSHWGRMFIYQLLIFPRLRARADELAGRDGHCNDLVIVMVTYRERPEVTRLVIESIVRECNRLQGLVRRPTLIVGTGCDEDDAAIADALMRATRAEQPSPLPTILFRCTEGKRQALAHGLERAMMLKPDSAGAFVLMDGDTSLEPGALTKTLPILKTMPEVAAVTTNEYVRPTGVKWFAEWLHFRHGQRDTLMSSMSLSKMLMCLTGRFAVFRTSVLDRGLIDVVRNDHIDHWLWGEYPLLSGDDKSTWFYLLQKHHRFLYVPDATVITHEQVAGSGVLTAYHNLRRWCGNMIRSSDRVLALGPSHMGLFSWWAFVDQRLSMWTTLLGPTALVMSLVVGRVDVAASYLLWVLATRTLRALPAWRHGRRVSFLYGPISAVLDWAAALVKIWVLFFPAKQFWYNRGRRELDGARGQSRTALRTSIAVFLLAVSTLALITVVAVLTHRLPLTRDLLLYRVNGWTELLGITVGAALVLAAFLAHGLRPSNRAVPRSDP